ncbi:hypothetical protein V5O48_000468 [Marasmius crinis-equi]|uniref:Proteasome assembly chaperone 3 n=1 Tax=Marasmius crinis-equi TaxID=585013 RepID=A0ABR3G1K0_9AGAR
MDESRNLNGIDTDVSIQHFRDSVLVLVSQLGKVGNLIQATIPPTTPLLPAPPPDPLEPNVQRLPPIPTAIQLTNLLGHAPSDHIHTLHNLYASQIAAIIWNAVPDDPGAQIPRKNVVIGIALRKTKTDDDSSPTEGEREIFSGVMTMVQEILRKGGN